MTKYILIGVFALSLVLSVIGLGMKVADQSVRLDLKDKEITSLKETQEQLIKSYEEDIAEREQQNKKRKVTVKEIIKVVGNEKCINDVIDDRIIDRVQQHNKRKN